MNDKACTLCSLDELSQLLVWLDANKSYQGHICDNCAEIVCIIKEFEPLRKLLKDYKRRTGSISI